MAPERSAADVVGALLRSVPDHPRPGITFWDLTPVLADPHGFRAATDWIASHGADADVVVGVEARGFLLGAAVARTLELGVVPVRKAGKLPTVAASVSYDLEYGSATLELPAGVLTPGQRVLLVDDVLATGGTAAAAASLVESAGAEVGALAVLLELLALDGRAPLGQRDVHALLTR